MASSSRSVLKLGPEDHGRPVSAEEFAEAEFQDPWTYQREAGRLIVMSPDSQEHDDCTEPLRDRLGAYRLARPDLVEQVVSEAWVRDQQGNDWIGDIGVYLVAEGPRPRRPERVPELIFEVVSPGKESRERDYVKKKRDYYHLGVLEYVVIDRFEQIATVFNRGARGYRKRVLGPGDTYTSPLLPGLVVPLTEVF